MKSILFSKGGLKAKFASAKQKKRQKPITLASSAAGINARVGKGDSRRRKAPITLARSASSEEAT